MRIEDLAKAQQEGAGPMLGALVNGARRRFLASARLLEWNSPVVQSLESFGIHKGIELWPLLDAFAELCARYREHFYSPQQSLLDRIRNGPDEVWAQWFYWKFLPCVLQDDSLVRNVLRSVGGLPTADAALSRSAVRQCFADMTLPTEKPLWAPEDVLTFS